MKISDILETTTAGAVATVAAPLGKVKRRKKKTNEAEEQTPETLARRVANFKSGKNTDPIEVVPASFHRGRWSYGDLQRLGLMSKSRIRSRWGDDGGDIEWTLNHDSGIAIKTRDRIMKPGDTDYWEA